MKAMDLSQTHIYAQTGQILEDGQCRYHLFGSCKVIRWIISRQHNNGRVIKVAFDPALQTRSLILVDKWNR